MKKAKHSDNEVKEHKPTYMERTQRIEDAFQRINTIYMDMTMTEDERDLAILRIINEVSQ